MGEPMNDSLPNQSASKRPDALDRVLSLLSSLKFALSVIVLIAAACIAGTVIPQGGQFEALIEKHPGAHPFMQAMSVLGLTRVFYTWWFVTLLCVLAASLSICTWRRYVMIGKTAGAAKARVIGSFVTHVSLLLVLAGGVVRVVWSQKGTIQFHEGQSVERVESPDGAFGLPFSVRLVKFELEFYQKPVATPEAQIGMLQVRWPERSLRAEFPVTLAAAHPLTLPGAPEGAEPAFTVEAIRYLPDFAIDSQSGEAQSRSDNPNNPAIQVRVTGGGKTNTQWVFAQFPDFGAHGGADADMPLRFAFAAAVPSGAMGRGSGSIKAFKSTIEMIENGAVVARKTIAVNAPFSHRGYTFYQLSYDPRDLSWSAIQVVKDPSVLIVYGGFVLMMVGLTTVFCIVPWMDTRRDASGGSA